MLFLSLLGCPLSDPSPSPSPSGPTGDTAVQTPTQPFAPLQVLALPVGRPVAGALGRPVPAPDGTWYATSPDGLHRSTDDLQSFAPDPRWPGGPAVTFAAAGSSLFVQLQPGAGYRRSDDGGATWASYPTPFEPLSYSYLWAYGTPAGTLWFLQASLYDGNRLVRSDDGGTTFVDVEIPHVPQGPNGIRFHRAPGDTLLLRSDDELLQTDDGGVTWTSYGDFPYRSDVFVDREGIVHLSHRVLNDWLHRRIVDGVVEDAVALPRGSFFQQLLDGRIVRVTQGVGTVSTSLDAGVTWTEEVSAFDDPTLGNLVDGLHVTDDGDLVARVDQRWTRWTPGDASWREVSPPTLPWGLDALDIAVGGAKIAVLGRRNNRGEVYVSEDGGATWAAGERFDVPFTALAMAPDGQDMFVGGSAGRYHFLDGNGRLRAGDDGQASSLTEHAIQQAAWGVSIGQEWLLVTAANPDDSDGALFRATPRASSRNWTALDPYRDPVAPQRDNPAGFHGVAIFGEIAEVGARLHVGGLARQDAWLSSYREWTMDPTTWDVLERPVAYGHAVSIAGPGGCPGVYLYNDQRLYYGADPVEISGAFVGELRDVACAPGGQVWVGTQLGVFQLVEP